MNTRRVMGFKIAPKEGLRMLLIAVSEGHVSVEKAMECFEEEDRQYNANLLKPITTAEWQTDVNDNQVTCHSRMVEGVLCRWWGDDVAPLGVAIIDNALSKIPPPPDSGGLMKKGI